MKTKLIFAILLFTSFMANAQQSIKIPESWDKLEAKADEVVNINLDRKMLRFASKFMLKDENGKDNEAKRVISNLNGIFVRGLEFKDAQPFSDADVEPIRAQLQGPEWSHIVNVNSKAEKEKVDIYVKTVNDQVMGMVILAQEPKELTFVNLDGAINPEDLEKLGGSFGIPKNIQGAQKKVVEETQASKTSIAVKK